VIEIDALVATWQERLAAVTRNANDLSEAEFTKRIRNRLREGRYAGLTRVRAEAALDKLSSLMDDFLLLARVIEDAADARKAGFLTSREAREAKVRALLEGTSIERPSVRVPLQQRELLGAAQQRDCLTPQALLTAMQNAFREARDALTEIDAAEQLGARDLADLRRGYAAMAQRALALQSQSNQPSFVELQDLLADPLGTHEGLASLRRALQAWSLCLAELEQARADAQTGVTVAREGLAELQRLMDLRAKQALSLREVFGADAAGSWPESKTSPLGMLTSWCDALENSLRTHEWHAVNVGLSRLKPALDAAITGEQGHIAAALARSAEVDDLLGRFRALKAKERTLRARGALPESCGERRAALEAALAVRPLDIDNLQSALVRYQDVLRADGTH
jgi:hypothetical protein